MRNEIYGALLLSLILVTACIRIEVEVPRQVAPAKAPSIPGGTKQPPPGTNPDSNGENQPAGAALPPPHVIPTQGSAKSCAADRHATRRVAQETGVWCWAASAEGVMSFHNMDLPQCQTVNRIKAGNSTVNGGSLLCCEDNSHPRCQKNGWTHEVLDQYGIIYNWWDKPLPRDAIKQQLCQNGPFSYSIDDGEGGGHSFVVSRYLVDEDELLVDDHVSFLDSDNRRISGGLLKLSYWEYQVGWDGVRPNRVDFNYYLINPAN